MEFRKKRGENIHEEAGEQGELTGVGFLQLGVGKTWMTTPFNSPRGIRQEKKTEP